MSLALTYANRIAEALRGRAFGEVTKLCESIIAEHKLKRWEASALVEMVRQRLGADADSLIEEWKRCDSQ